MFRVLIEHVKEKKVTKRIDIKRITTEKVQNLIGRYLMKYENFYINHDEGGYKEYEFFTRDAKGQEEETVSVSFWRFSKSDEKSGPMVETKKNTTPSPPPAPPVEKPKDARLEEMADDLNTSYY